MRAIVISDTHGMGSGLRLMLDRIWAMQPGRIDAYIHCGDGVTDFFQTTDYMKAHDPASELHVVRGNCDWLADEDDAPIEEVFRFGGAGVMLCHGHRYSVKNSREWVDEAGYGRGCAVTLYGHTHTPDVDPRRTLLVNPGSAADGCFAILDISGGKANARLYKV